MVKNKKSFLIKKEMSEEYPLEVYDNVFNRSTAFNIIKVLRKIKEQNVSMHGHFYRNQIKNDNPIEDIIKQVLDQLEDNSKIVEYWYRLTWIDMHCHQDVNESKLREDDTILCPNNGHILYISEITNESSTMIFNKDLSAVSVITPFVGRLVRFHGKAFHYVPSPFSSIFGDQVKANTKKIRVVILFNTWDDYIPGKEEVNPIYPSIVPININNKKMWHSVSRLEYIKNFDDTKPVTNFTGLLGNDKNIIIRVRYMGNENRRLGMNMWEYYLINNLIKKIGSTRSFLTYEIKNVKHHNLKEGEKFVENEEIEENELEQII